MKLSFDIKYKRDIQLGIVKVETEHGNPIRIICWDKIGDYPIVGLFTYWEDGIEWEDVECWDIYGKPISGINDMDLCIITNKKQ
jgi:hypothetical protein